jgi:hypothetical protein
MSNQITPEFHAEIIVTLFNGAKSRATILTPLRGDFASTD